MSFQNDAFEFFEDSSSLPDCTCTIFALIDLMSDESLASSTYVLEVRPLRDSYLRQQLATTR